MIDKRERAYQAYGVFLTDFVRDLNHMSEEGWSLLVEGLRDQRALRKLGYMGPLFTVSLLGRNGAGALGDSKKLVILTDLDREGGVLASKFVKRMNHEGVTTSLAERRRLKRASRGVFLHVENMERFAKTDPIRWEFGIASPVDRSSPPRAYREGIRRFRRTRGGPPKRPKSQGPG